MRRTAATSAHRGHPRDLPPSSPNCLRIYLDLLGFTFNVFLLHVTGISSAAQFCAASRVPYKLRLRLPMRCSSPGSSPPSVSRRTLVFGSLHGNKPASRRCSTCDTGSVAVDGLHRWSALFAVVLKVAWTQISQGGCRA